MTGLLLRAHVIGIDSFPIEDKPPPQRHAYITWARLLKHGFTRGCSGCAMGHNRHSDECKARFDAIFSMRGEAVGPTPKPIADGEETEYEPSPPDLFQKRTSLNVHQGPTTKRIMLQHLSPDSCDDLRFSRAKTR